MVVSAAHFANQGKLGADTARNCSPTRWSPGLVGAVRPARSFVFHSHISTPPGGYDVGRLFYCWRRVERFQVHCYNREVPHARYVIRLTAPANPLKKRVSRTLRP